MSDLTPVLCSNVRPDTSDSFYPFIVRFYISVALSGVLSLSPPASPGIVISLTLRIPRHDNNEKT
jgi:hypothetical protein